MLKTLSTESAESRKGGIGIGGGSKAGRNRSELDCDEVYGGEVKGDEIGKKVQKTSKSKKSSKSK